MKQEQYKCDKCGEDLPSEVYVLSHTSWNGRLIMGDNRVDNDKHFCRDCFGKYFAPLLV